MRKFIAGAAAIALAAGAAQAQPGKDKGNGNGNGNSAAKVDRGGGGNGNGKADRGNGNAIKADRGPSMAQRGNGNGNADRGPQMKTNRGNGNGNAVADRGPQMKVDRGNGNGNAARAVVRDQRRDVERRVDRDLRDGRDYRDVDWRRAYYDGGDYRGLVDGCPPGLAKKNNGCLPPGQAKKLGGYSDRYAYRPSYFGYGDFGSGRYMYNDGYLMRYDGDRISGYIPLLGGALSVGNRWPEYYRDVNVPDYYRDYYNLGSNGSYRYADDVFYRVDPQTSAITSIVALLTGDQFTVGQPMPMGYDVYNVPYAYRDRYYDTPDSYYRYSDGYVYQVDPTTRLVQAAIQLLT